MSNGPYTYSVITPEMCRTYLRREDKAKAVCALAERFWKQQFELSDALYEADAIPGRERKPVQVLGAFYPHMRDGSIPCAISHLIEIWRAAGRAVVLFTDCGPSPEDVSLPDGTTRVKLAPRSAQCTASAYAERGGNLAALLKHYQIDCMVYHAACSDTLLFDACICHAMGAAFVLHTHHIFSSGLRYHDPQFAITPRFARLADAVVCLDSASRQWWQCFNGNTYYVKDIYGQDIGAQWEEIFGSLTREAPARSSQILLTDVLISDYWAGCKRRKRPLASLLEKMTWYYTQFGFRRTVGRMAEELKNLCGK